MHYINIIMYYVFDKWQRSHKEHLDNYEILDEDVVGGNLISSKTDLLWHHDKAYTNNPPSYAALYCNKIDKGASPTYFANLQQAYQDAPQELKDKAEDVICKHTFENYVKQGHEYPVHFEEKSHERYFRKTSRAEHPLVMENEKGKFFFFSSGYTDAGDLTEELIEHCFQEKYIFKQYWQEGRLVIWNNYIYPHARKSTDKGLQREFIRYALNK